MARRCKFCKSIALPPAAQCKDITNKKGYCSIKCLADHQSEKRIAAREKKARAQRKKDKAAVVELNRKDLKWQHKQTQPAYNRMRVLEEMKWFKDRELEPVCISCGKPNMDWCCGHFKTVGAQGVLRYDRLNTYLQCNRYCNKGLSGNIEGNKTTRGYKKGLVDRFGDDEAQRIIEYCEAHTEAYKWTCDELEEMRAEFSRLGRELKQSGI